MTRSKLLCAGVLICAACIAAASDEPAPNNSNNATSLSTTTVAENPVPLTTFTPASIQLPVSGLPAGAKVVYNVTIVLPAQPATPAPVQGPITTQRFENGSIHWADLSPAQIEGFLRDLNQRRDYDFSQHNEQPGPNHDFLTSWITQAVQQLVSRGYTVDQIGDLHRPDQTIVATR